jgi:excisionase family DNA binding protein
MAGHKDIDPMLTASDVAHLLNVHVNTVRRWSNQGILKAYRIGSRGDRRFHEKDIASFLLQESKIANIREWGSTFERLSSTDGNNLVVDSKNRYNT